jgi:hypothetical protein
MAKKQRKAATAIKLKSIDVHQTMIDEIAEAVELQRPHFPNDDEDALRAHAVAWRAERYRIGHWPDFAKVAKAETAKADAAEAAAKATEAHGRARSRTGAIT